MKSERPDCYKILCSLLDNCQDYTENIGAEIRAGFSSGARRKYRTNLSHWSCTGPIGRVLLPFFPHAPHNKNIQDETVCSGMIEHTGSQQKQFPGKGTRRD